MFMAANEDRDTKIANYKLKKLLEANIERLRDYQDEEAKRDFYLNQIKLTIMASLDQLAMTEMEMSVLKHRAGLTAEQLAENDRRSAKPENPQKMNAQYFGVSLQPELTFFSLTMLIASRCSLDKTQCSSPPSRKKKLCAKSISSRCFVRSSMATLLSALRRTSSESWCSTTTSTIEPTFATNTSSRCSSRTLSCPP